MKKIAIVAGGNSGEHDVSLKTAANIFKVLDKKLFTPYLIHLKGAEWMYIDENENRFPVDKNDFSVMVNGEKILFDAVFIAIHGNPGEDGRLQGYLEMLGIPYTGCDCFTSALTFNKYFCNMAAAKFGVPVADSLHFYDDEKIDLQQVGKFCGFPCFVKPCNSGSSVGVTKVHNEAELDKALKEAFKWDNQLMVEKYIHGKEVTCGVLKKDGKPKALAVTCIVSKNEFYDFESKYAANLHEMVTPAPIHEQAMKDIMRYSEILYQRLGCKGIVRMDYIVTPENKPMFLEVNTIPGQTALSIVPHQVEHMGLNLSDIYTQLIEEALEK